ncbi:hypothetical protein ALC56_05425 [Trachymyrmex septentrionalis]|uniref:Uncharacterized protein n=1 Tax=Trachymyrmex septentrionalis TaxID=34720 RepID=A0A195FII6_9HYME|nr:hypothetical protein ALC56_05425 [Trachymyrmex septentrionalis]
MEAGAQRGVIRYVVTRCLHPPAPSTSYRPYVPPLFCLYPIPISSSHHRVPVSAFESIRGNERDEKRRRTKTLRLDGAQDRQAVKDLCSQDDCSKCIL